MPRQVLLTTLILTGLAGLGGFWLGLQQTPQDISGLINSVARAHVADYGGTEADCIGWVRDGEDALRVTCGAYEYRIAPDGRVFLVTEPET